MASLKLQGITKHFGAVRVLQNIDLDVADNEFTVFVGPSGCGKSTLLRLISGLEDATDGDIFIGAQRVNDLPPAKRKIAMVFQNYALYPHMTVYDNIAFGLRVTKYAKDEIRRRVEKAAKTLHLEALLDRKPKELSGGQRQRVAIGRAIIKDPQIFLFDEPLSNLDAALRVQMRMEIMNLKKEIQTTMIYVTHDQTEAMTLADKIVVLREGRIEQVGTPLELYHHPANQFVAGFIGSPQMNFLLGVVSETAPQQITFKLSDQAELHLPFTPPKTLKAGTQLTLGVRPEHITLTDHDVLDTIPGTVEFTERLGSDTYLYVTTAGGRVVVRDNGTSPIRAGEKVVLKIDVEHSHLFDEAGVSLDRPQNGLAQ